MSVIQSSDVIDQEAVRAQVEEYANESRVYREAFRQIDSTDIDSNKVEIPVLDEVRAAGVVAEGDTYPSASDATRKVPIDHEKHGVEVDLTYEAIQDALLDVIALHTEERGEDLADALNDAAYQELADYDSSNSVYNNLQDAPIGDDSGNLTYDNAVDAMTAIEAEGYSPDLLIVSAQSKGDLMKSDEFTRASELGDSVVRDGAFGEVAGVDVLVDEAGHLGAGEGIMVDSERYGIESMREDMTSLQYEREEENKSVVQVRTRMGWKAIRPTAGVKIEG